jgi:hypothetical protein
MTLAQARAVLRDIGWKIRRTPEGEYRVAPRNHPREEALAYYTTALDDAVDTAKMEARRMGKISPNPDMVFGKHRTGEPKGPGDRWHYSIDRKRTLCGRPTRGLLVTTPAETHLVSCKSCQRHLTALLDEGYDPEAQQRRYIEGNPPDQRARTITIPKADDLIVETWAERDRQWVGVRDERSGELVMQWWDDEVSQMIEDGFFYEPHGIVGLRHPREAQKFRESVLQHLKDTGLAR